MGFGQQNMDTMSRLQPHPPLLREEGLLGASSASTMAVSPVSVPSCEPRNLPALWKIQPRMVYDSHRTG